MPHPAAEIRTAAAIAIENLVRQQGDIVPWSAIAVGFKIGSERVLFANQVRGIFKPSQLNDGAPLSIKSTRPSRAGRAAAYDDEFIEDGMLHYKFQGDDPNNADNQLLKQAYQLQLPLIYFSGLADAVYQVFYPVVVDRIDIKCMEARMVWKNNDATPDSRDFVLNDPQPSFGRRTAANQLHYARFRANVLSAYGFRCAFSKLHIGSLLKATSIIADADKFGVSAINNSICMSVLHKAAFDAHLIGVNPKGVVQVGRLLHEPKHAMLLGQLSSSLSSNQTIHLPKSRKLWPNRDCLNERFKQFEAAQK